MIKRILIVALCVIINLCVLVSCRTPIEQDTNSEQNQYEQFMTKLNPLIVEMDELFYREMDADGDGNTEIIAAFGHSEIESCFVLREQDGEIQLVKQDFLPEYGYFYRDMQLVQFTGSDLSYIAVGITNTANMSGLSIYRITENDVLYVDGAQSAVGVCDAYLSDKKEDGSYGGFTAEFASYDVLYYPTVVTSHFQNGDFDWKTSEVDVGEYPKTPADVVIHYLSLYCLHQRYFSDDIVERNQEIYTGWWDLSYVNEPGWIDALYHYILGIDSDSSVLTADEVITGQKAKVTIHFTDETTDTVILEFDMVLNNEKWHIESAKESVWVKSNGKSLVYETIDVEKKFYNESGDYMELLLQLPKLTGNYAGISKINNFFIGKEEYFYDDIDIDGNLKGLEEHRKEYPPEDDSERIKGASSGWYRSADYRFEAVIDNVISMSAWLNGGLGGVNWLGMEGNTFNLNTGKRLGLSDIFKVSEDKYMNIIYDFVSQKIAANISEALKMGNESMYWFDDAYSGEGYETIRQFNSDDFYLNEKALVVFYSKYTFSAGAAGLSLNIFEIPYDLIKDTLAIDL